MHQLPPEISRKEAVLFDLFCCVNELLDLRNELSALDLSQITEGFKKLHLNLLETKPHHRPVYLALV